MAYETETLFLALLALGLAVFVVAVGLLMLAPAGRALLQPVRAISLELAALVAVVATAGSLYLSEVAGYLPCRLCWIQRGFMYPAAAFLVVALATRKRLFAALAGVLAVGGLPVSIFHRIEQATGEIGGVCDPNNPCSIRWINHFDFITIPTMAGVGFVGIATLVSLHLFWRSP